jgi:hypothetical protein
LVPLAGPASPEASARAADDPFARLVPGTAFTPTPAPHPEPAVPILVMLLCFVLAFGLIAP